MRLLKKLIMLAVILSIALVTYINQFMTMLGDFQTTALSREAQINRHVDLSKGLIDLMGIYGTDFFSHKSSTLSDLWGYLQYDAEHDRYHLDSIEGTPYRYESGNLTGSGEIPVEAAAVAELNMAMQLNHLFKSVFSNVPDAAWLYYTSENNFISLYPWISSADFTYSEALNQEVFYTCVTPRENPFRESRWSPVYLDHAGKGLMVSVSSPIYNEDLFMGVVSLDLTNEQLSDMIKSDYESYILDPVETVIASSWDKGSDERILHIDAVMQTSPEYADRIRAIDDNRIARIGQHYYFSARINNAPWKLISRISIWTIIGRSALFTLPVFLVGILLLLATIEVEKRKATEILLTDSMRELQSYHKMLENAAKYDFLTSTVNRRGLMDLFNTKILENPDMSLSVLLSDIDLFKQFNDQYGHAAGDKVLIEITRIIQQHLTPDDVLCRWGGEEFVILLEGRDSAQAFQIAEKIRQEIETNRIPWENMTLQATMTFGVVDYDHAINFEDNVAKADRALYFAKRSGRNRVISYEAYQTQLESGSEPEQRGRHS